MSLATKSAPDETLNGQPNVDECHALIERIAGSAQFRRSARLRDFLLYVGHKSLEGGSPDIHEQEIGARVFGRPESYDRSQDNIVRVNATELRKRIELYFASEGADESLILQIPRGGYKPHYSWRPVASEPILGSSILAPLQEHDAAHARNPEEHTPSALSQTSLRAHVIWASVSLSLALICGLLLRQNAAMHKSFSSSEDGPAVIEFWKDFLAFHQTTDVVLPDDSASLIQDITKEPISLGDYLNRDYMRQIQASRVSTDRKLDLNEVFGHNLVTFGGVRAAQEVLASMPGASPTHTSFSRYFAADSLKHDNVILVGGRKANPWVYLFNDQLNFITDFKYDGEHSGSLVTNRNPTTGELAAYFPTGDGNRMEGYSVLAYLPNPSHTGNAIILAGTDSDATDAAAEFLASEEQMQKLRATLHVQKFPYFEVLLKTSRLNGTLLRAEMVAYRTH
jgi:hypothetical protein